MSQVFQIVLQATDRASGVLRAVTEAARSAYSQLKSGSMAGLGQGLLGISAAFGVIGGAIAGVTGALSRFTGALAQGLQEAVALERATLRLGRTMKDLAAARMEANAITNSPLGKSFDETSLVAADNALRRFTKNALGGARDMQVLADVAADTDADINQLAQSIGMVAGRLMAGDSSFGRFAMQLVSTGAVTADVVREMERMADSGKSAGDVIAYLFQQLERQHGGALKEVNADLDITYRKAKDIVDDSLRALGRDVWQPLRDIGAWLLAVVVGPLSFLVQQFADLARFVSDFVGAKSTGASWGESFAQARDNLAASRTETAPQSQDRAAAINKQAVDRVALEDEAARKRASDEYVQAQRDLAEALRDEVAARDNLLKDLNDTSPAQLPPPPPAQQLPTPPAWLPPPPPAEQLSPPPAIVPPPAWLPPPPATQLNPLSIDVRPALSGFSEDDIQRELELLRSEEQAKAKQTDSPQSIRIKEAQTRAANATQRLRDVGGLSNDDLQKEVEQARKNNAAAMERRDRILARAAEMRQEDKLKAMSPSERVVEAQMRKEDATKRIEQFDTRSEEYATAQLDLAQAMRDETAAHDAVSRELMRKSEEITRAAEAEKRQAEETTRNIETQIKHGLQKAAEAEQQKGREAQQQAANIRQDAVAQANDAQKAEQAAQAAKERLLNPNIAKAAAKAAREGEREQERISRLAARARSAGYELQPAPGGEFSAVKKGQTGPTSKRLEEALVAEAKRKFAENERQKADALQIEAARAQVAAQKLLVQIAKNTEAGPVI